MPETRFFIDYDLDLVWYEALGDDEGWAIAWWQGHAYERRKDFYRYAIPLLFLAFFVVGWYR